MKLFGIQIGGQSKERNQERIVRLRSDFHRALNVATDDVTKIHVLATDLIMHAHRGFNDRNYMGKLNTMNQAEAIRRIEGKKGDFKALFNKLGGSIDTLVALVTAIPQTNSLNGTTEKKILERLAWEFSELKKECEVFFVSDPLSPHSVGRISELNKTHKVFALCDQLKQTIAVLMASYVTPAAMF